MKIIDGCYESTDAVPPEAVAGPGAPSAGARRRFIQAAGALGATRAVGGLGALGLLAGPGPASAAVALEGYASRVSARPGQIINFHVRDPGGSLTADTQATVRIVRLAGWVDITELQATLTVRDRAVPADALSAGCNWPVSWSLTIPPTWRSGVYYAFFLGAVGSGCCVPFVVRPASKTAGVKVLVQLPTITAQLRNTYGGRSRATDPNNGSPKVAFDRPFDYRFNFDFDGRQAPLARWLNRKGVAADFCTDVDAHAEPGLLNGYTLVLKAGRDEFWTYEGRTGFDAFVASGGNAVLVGALHCKSQARLETSQRTGVSHRVAVYYANPFEDPDARPDFKTTFWSNIAVSRGPEGSVGLQTLGPEYTGTGPRPPTPAMVHVPHWSFEGTGLNPGSTFGADVMGPFLGGVANYRAPALHQDPQGATRCPEFTRPMLADSGRPTPPQLTILASADTSQWPPINDGGTQLPWGSGHIVIFSRGGGAGTVFNAGSLDWVQGLIPEVHGLAPTVVGRITMNLVRRLASGAHYESAELRNFRVGVPNPRDRYELSIGDVRTLTTYTATYQRGYLGRVHVSQVPGTVPVLRYTAKTGDAKRYRYTLDPGVVGPGWVADGVAFYAFATQAPNTEPIYVYIAVGDPRNALDRGWRFLYSRHATLPEPLDCDLDGVNWIRSGVAWYGPAT